MASYKCISLLVLLAVCLGSLNAASISREERSSTLHETLRRVERILESLQKELDSRDSANQIVKEERAEGLEGENKRNEDGSVPYRRNEDGSVPYRRNEDGSVPYRRNEDGSVPYRRNEDGSVPYKRNEDGSVPYRRNEDGSVPYKRNEDGSVPYKRNEDGSVPYKRNEDGSVPYKRNEDGSVPYKRNEDGSVPYKRNEDGSVPYKRNEASDAKTKHESLKTNGDVSLLVRTLLEMEKQEQLRKQELSDRTRDLERSLAVLARKLNLQKATDLHTQKRDPDMPFPMIDANHPNRNE